MTLPLDLVLRSARVATASDCFDADIGIQAGRVVQIGAQLPKGVREIDAAGRVVTPGGVDAHCHLDQPMAPPVRMADDFDTGTRAAACGGTTTVIPFAAQEKGHSLRAAVDEALAEREILLDAGAKVMWAISGPYTLQFSLDIFNLLNMQTAKWVDMNYTFDFATPMQNAYWARH